MNQLVRQQKRTRTIFGMRRNKINTSLLASRVLLGWPPVYAYSYPCPSAPGVNKQTSDEHRSYQGEEFVRIGFGAETQSKEQTSRESSPNSQSTITFPKGQGVTICPQLGCALQCRGRSETCSRNEPTPGASVCRNRLHEDNPP